jgi:hypothetical protein
VAVTLDNVEEYVERMSRFILHDGISAQVRCLILALSQSIWPHRFGAPGSFFAPKLTGLYREPSVST